MRVCNKFVGETLGASEDTACRRDPQQQIIFAVFASADMEPAFSPLVLEEIHARMLTVVLLRVRVSMFSTGLLHTYVSFQDFLFKACVGPRRLLSTCHSRTVCCLWRKDLLH